MQDLIAASTIVLYFEANDEAALKRIQEDFRRVILGTKPDAVLPF